MSSVYMCFPCYQEFPTLEEVLTHQLSCTAEPGQAPPPQSAADAAELASQTEVFGESVLIPQVQLEESADLLSQAKAHPADSPRILYQCADCDILYDSLSLWQQHRKLGHCHERGAGPEQPHAHAQPTYGQLEEAEGAQFLTVEGGASNEDCAPEESEAAGEAGGGAVVTTTEDQQLVCEPPASAEPSEPAEPASPPVRRRGQKKAKPPSCLLCVDCGMSFSLVPELVAHRRSRHGLEEALHRCTVCGESFLNTTLFLYHRKHHRACGETEQRAPPEPPGQGLLLLATAGEGHTMMELQHALPEGSVAQMVVQQEEVVVVEASGEVEQFQSPEEEERDDEGNTGQEENGGEEVMEAANEEASVVEQVESAAPATQAEEETDIKADEGEMEVEKDGENKGEEEEAMEATPQASVEQKFLCNSCASCFGTEQELAQHRSAQHGLAGALHYCELCGEEFMNTTQFLYHRREHRASAPKGPAPALPLRPAGSSAVETAAAGRAAQTAIPQPSPADSATANLPPPAQLSRDWSRTPLPHACPHCGRGFTRRCLLRAHVSSHTGEKLFSCKVCGKAFSSPGNLLRHTQTHGGARPFTCSVCEKTFYEALALKRHMLTHTAGEHAALRRRRRGRGGGAMGRLLYHCPECPASFKLETQLQSHRLLHTSHPFRCAECDKAFKRRKDLDLHALAHQDKEPKTCPNCGNLFLNDTMLEAHLRRCLAAETEYSRPGGKGQGRGRTGGQLECDMCGHRCVTQDGLDLHRLSHTGQTPLRCPLLPCRRRFASSTALGKHVLAHCKATQAKGRAAQRFRCQHCGKEFAYASTFSVHMRIHTDERPFECSQCGKRFRQLPHLQDHVRIHSGERPFTCWVCGKSFSVAARLTEHARVHSGERPYACPRCPTAFRSRPNLDKHMRLHADDPADPMAEGEGDSAVQTILLVQSSSPTSSSASLAPDGTVVMSALQGAEQVATAGGVIPGTASSSVVYLHPSITVPTISVPTISVPTVSMPSMSVPTISVVESQEVPHTIEFIIEETV